MQDELTEKIIGYAFKVHNQLGPGFLEKVYENALAVELRRTGIGYEQQYPVPVFYDGEKVGDFFADIVVEGRIICELKACEALSKAHEVQLVNYLVATGMETGLLINFGSSVTVRRKYRERRKGSHPVNPENPVNPV